MIADGNVVRAADDIDQLIRSWIVQNIDFEKGRENREALFIRTRGVRAYVKVEPASLATRARDMIANLADSFGLGYEDTTDRVNLIVTTASGIADGRKPNRSVLRALALPQISIDHLESEADWSSGCGMYNAINDSGRLSFSVVVADSALSDQQLVSCITTGVVFSFGFRPRGKEFHDYSTEYVQFILLARAIGTCEKKLSAQKPDGLNRIRDASVECIVTEVRTKFSK